MPKPSTRLEYLRKINFLSQKEVAEALGMSQQFYFKIEKGKSKLTIETADSLKDIFKLSCIDELLREVS
ncbi:helix-turn-helix transcriptional regulator [Paenibacillus sp. FSL R5-0490]|uniref:helix-turn-helix domain-containing protein n=1 Tax=unclassified Paenibacillus TaxID=185978 RepID=UPI0030CD6ABC